MSPRKPIDTEIVKERQSVQAVDRSPAKRLRTVAHQAVGALAMAAFALAVAAPGAQAAFGDTFGLADAPPGGVFQGASAFYAGTCDLADPEGEVGSPPAAPQDCLDFGSAGGILSFSPWDVPPTWRLAASTGAGSHPDGTTAFAFKRTITGSSPEPDGNVRSTIVDLPAGFTGAVTATPKCPAEQLRIVPATGAMPCLPSTQVGVATLVLRGTLGFVVARIPVYNAEPRRGNAAELVIPGVAGLSNVPITAKVRSSGDFGISALSTQIPTGYPVYTVQLTLWGTPWAPVHDRWRPRSGWIPPVGTANVMPAVGLAVSDRASYDPSWGPVRPLLNNPTECTGQDVDTSLSTDSWQHPDVFLTYESSSPPVTGCDKVPFDPSIGVQSSSAVADAATGVSVGIAVPQSDDPGDLSSSHLKDTVVELSEGLSVNPSGATGLEACSDDEVGLRGTSFPAPAPVRFTDDDPFDGVGQDCPDGSVIGAVDVVTPLLDESIAGDLVLGEPRSTDPESGEMFRLFLVLRDRERGLLVKAFGSATADPATGRLRATFENSPQLPFSDLTVRLKGGQRGVLATPPSCGEKTTQAVLTPWTAAHGAGGVAKTVTSPFTISDCRDAFTPGLAAGMDIQAARESGAFSFVFSRQDGEQYLRGLTAKLPTGLLASVKGLVGPSLCSNAQADAGSCPAESRIGTVDASAGAGSPFVLEEKGDVFLTEGYRGGQYGLAVKIRAVAGPFRGQYELSPIIVRQAIHVDRTTAQVTAISDPLPVIHHGVPLRVRSVTIKIDRPSFMLNPSDCSEKRVGSTFDSLAGTSFETSNRFQVADCASLPFGPAFALDLVGRNQVRTGTHPAVRARVTQRGVAEAGIRRAVVRLPKSLALDPDNAQALCEFVDGTKPDLENYCPAGSIVGRARAKTPLLNRDLVGNVYFVKNVRRDPKTGNLIRTLPMLVVALRGEIAINLRGESSTTGAGKLVNTFDQVPDAPITQFNLNIKGGPDGILAVTRTRKAKINLCASRQIAEVDTDGQNGRRHDFDIRIKTPCTKAQVKKAKRAAKKAASKARKAARS